MEKFIKSRPLAFVLLSFVLSSFFVSCISLIPKIIISSVTFVSSLVLIILSLRKKKTNKTMLIISASLSAVFISCIISLISFDLVISRYDSLSSKTDTVEIEITDVVYSKSYGARYIAKVRKSDAVSKNTKVYLDSETGTYSVRDILYGEIEYTSLRDDVNGYDEKRTAISKRIMVSCSDTGLVFREKDEAFSLYMFFTELNQTLSDRLKVRISNSDSGLSSALVLGDRSSLTDVIRRDFRRIGIYHMLALSGTHLSVLVLILNTILFRFSQKKKALVTIITVLMSMALTGFSPSVTRAGIMLIIAQTALLADREADFTISLSVSGALMILINPYIIYDYGFQLSFIAAHGCMTAGSAWKYFFAEPYGKYLTIKVQRKNRFVKLLNRGIRRLLQAVLLTFTVTAFTIPLTALYFGEFSVLSVVSNLIFLIPITLIIIFTIAYLVFYRLGFLAVILSKIIILLSSFVSDFSDKLALLKGITIPLNYSFSFVFIIPIGILVILAFTADKKALKRIIAGVFALFLSFIGVICVYNSLTKNNVYTEYVTAAKNDGLAVKTGGSLMLIDSSDGSYSFFRNLSATMNDMNSCEIEAYVYTHYHQRHAAAFSVIADSCIVRNVIMPDPVSDTDVSVYSSIVRTAESHEINVITTDRINGDTVYFNDIRLVTYPYMILSRSTHPVSVFSVCYENGQLLYAGGSYNECGDDVIDASLNSEYIIYGAHSPVTKKAIDGEFISLPTAVYISSQAFDNMSESIISALGECGWIEDSVKYRLRQHPLQQR